MNMLISMNKLMPRKHARHAFLSFLTIFCTLSVPMHTRAHRDLSFKQHLYSYWRDWYNFRHSYIYPINNILACLSQGSDNPTNPLQELRISAGYEKLGEHIPSGYPLLNAQLCVGIADAILAEKPAEKIVRDDIVHFLAFYGCLIALDTASQTIYNDHHTPRALIDPIIQNKFAKIALAFIKYKVTDTAAYIISRPIGYLAYHAVKSGKKTMTTKKVKDPRKHSHTSRTLAFVD